MNETYDRLEQAHERPPKVIRDHSEAWAKLQPVMNVNGQVQARILEFAASKRITMMGLVALGTRVDATTAGDIRLAWGYPAFRAGRHIISAVKRRSLGSGDRDALKPSVFLEPLVIGNRHSLDMFVAEGETDACRLFDLVGDAASILVLPAGARTFKKEWASYLPRGATVHLAHDADEDGDQGAEKARRILGGGVRVRPPDGYGDWCEWDGSREDFVQLVGSARQHQGVLYAVEKWSEFRDQTDANQKYLVDGVHPEGGVVFLGAEPKAGKTWLALYRDVCLAVGAPFLGHSTQRVPVLYVGLEGMRTAIRTRVGCLARGLDFDPDGSDLELLHILHRPRGFDLASEETAEWVCSKVTELGARIVTFDTMRSAAQVRESNEGAQDFAKLLRLLNPLTTSNVSVEFLHHYTKLNETRQLRAAADRMSGTGALRGHLDVGVFITRFDPTERRMRVEYELRDGAALDPIGVRIDGNGTGPYGGFTYHDTARLVLEDTVINEQETKAPSGEIAAWILSQPAGRATAAEICDKFEISARTLTRRRAEVCSWGIEYVDAGRSSHYKAAEEGMSDSAPR